MVSYTAETNNRNLHKNTYITRNTNAEHKWGNKLFNDITSANNHENDGKFELLPTEIENKKLTTQSLPMTHALIYIR